jgi:hypothetical protein
MEIFIIKYVKNPNEFQAFISPLVQTLNGLGKFYFQMKQTQFHYHFLTTNQNVV